MWVSEVYVNEVWHDRNGIVARGGARGRIRSRRPGSGHGDVAATGSAAGPALAARADLTRWPASRTGSGPANLATIRAAVIAAIKDAGYLHITEGRRDHTTPAETLRLHGLE